MSEETHVKDVRALLRKHDPAARVDDAMISRAKAKFEARTRASGRLIRLPRKWIMLFAVLAGASSLAAWTSFGNDLRRMLGNAQQVWPPKKAERLVEQLPVAALPVETPPSTELLKPALSNPQPRPVAVMRAPIPRKDGLPVHELPVPPVVELPAPSRLGEEVALLQRAVSQLENDANAAAALETVRLHNQSFREGALKEEFFELEVRALISTGQKELALSRLGAASEPDRRDRRIVRAELLAAGGDCESALAMLHSPETVSQRDRLAERALYLKGHCAAVVGQGDAAKAYLRMYQAQFPQGKRAIEVEATLNQLR